MLTDEAGTGARYTFEADGDVAREELDKACAGLAKKMQATEVAFRGELIQVGVAKSKMWFLFSKGKRKPRD